MSVDLQYISDSLNLMYCICDISFIHHISCNYHDLCNYRYKYGNYMKYDNWLSHVFQIGLVGVRVSYLCDFCNGFNRLLELVLGLWFK